MADQDRCPECGNAEFGTGVIFHTWDCPAVMANMSPADSADDKPPISPDLPDEVLDRAANQVPASRAGIGSERLVRTLLRQAGPVLVEHGRQQERALIAVEIRAGLQPEEPGSMLVAGPLGEHIAEECGTYSLEFVAPDELADALASWLEGGRLTLDPIAEAEARGAATERARVKGLVSTRAHQARADYKADPCEYHRAQEDAWNDLLAALDKEVGNE